MARPPAQTAMETAVRSRVAAVILEAFPLTIHPAASLAVILPEAFRAAIRSEAFPAAASRAVMVGEAVTAEEAEAVKNST